VTRRSSQARSNTTINGHFAAGAAWRHAAHPPLRRTLRRRRRCVYFFFSADLLRLAGA